jgi:hypothetical protein
MIKEYTEAEVRLIIEGTKQEEREWVGLTDEDLVDCETEFDVAFARAIEAKLKEKNEKK